MVNSVQILNHKETELNLPLQTSQILSILRVHQRAPALLSLVREKLMLFRAFLSRRFACRRLFAGEAHALDHLKKPQKSFIKTYQ